MSFTISQLSGLQTSKYFNVGGLAILVFDYAITLEDEVQWVWGRKWDVTRCIFTISRYLPFVGVTMTAYDALRTNNDPCDPDTEENIIHILGIIAAELLLVLRTYAYWQGNKRVLYGLLVYSVATILGAVAVKIAPWESFPGEEPPNGCYLFAPRDSYLVYLFLLVFEFVIFSMTAYKRFRSYRDVTGSMVNTVYRDGMFYVGCIMLVTFTNILIIAVFAYQFSELLDAPQLTIHSVLASRILFNLRKHSYMIENGNTTMTGDVFFSDSYHASAEPQSFGSASSELRGLTSVFVDAEVDDVDGDRRRDNTFRV